MSLTEDKFENEIQFLARHLPTNVPDAVFRRRILATIQQLKNENERLWEFLHAHDAVENGVVGFDLHNSAVTRLRKARLALEEEAG